MPAGTLNVILPAELRLTDPGRPGPRPHPYSSARGRRTPTSPAAGRRPQSPGHGRARSPPSSPQQDEDRSADLASQPWAEFNPTEVQPPVSPKCPLTADLLASRAAAPFLAVTVLDLSYLGLDDLPGTLLEPLQSLEILILGHNQLRDVGSLCQAKLSAHLWAVDLSHNRLRTIGPFHFGRVLGLLMLNANLLTWKGVTSLLESSCMSELYLEGNPSLRRPDYRAVVARLALGVLALDGAYLTPAERLHACYLDAAETVPLAPELAADKSAEPKVPDLKVKFQALNRLIKQVGQRSKGTQLLSLIRLDLEDKAGQRGRRQSPALGLTEGEKRRLRYLSLFHTAFFNLLQSCPAQSLFQYDVPKTSPEYSSSRLTLGQALAHGLEHGRLLGVNVGLITNALPFCIPFWRDHKEAAQCLFQLVLASLYFQLPAPLVGEALRRALQRERDGPVLAQDTVDSVARAAASLPPYGRLALLLLLAPTYEFVLPALVQYFLNPHNEGLRETVALSAHRLIAGLGFTTATEPDNADFFAVSGQPPEEPFSRDYTLPTDFVYLSRDPDLNEQHREWLQDRQQRALRQAQREAREALLTERRHEERRQPETPLTLPRSGLGQPAEETRRWRLRLQRKGWGGVAALDQRPPGVVWTSRLPAVGEHVHVPLSAGNIPGDGAQVYVIHEYVEEQRLVRLISLAAARQLQQAQLQQRALQHHARVEEQFQARNTRKSVFWKGSALKPKAPAAEGRDGPLPELRRMSGGSGGSGANSGSISQSLVVPCTSLAWNAKGYWVRVKAPSPAVVPIVAEGRPEAGEDHTFMTGVNLDSPHALTVVLGQTAPPFEPPPAAEAERVTLVYDNPFYARDEQMDWPPDDPRHAFHPFTKDYFEQASRLKARMHRLLSLRPLYEPPVNPETGQPACSATLEACKRGYEWEAQSPFFMPTTFRTRLLTAHMPPPPNLLPLLSPSPK
eukprot:EG_transcript_2155